jgi:molecular chaperone DnaK
VTFDIDANGILHVSAKDKDTGAEQEVTISESSTLPQEEVERMVSDAEAHRSEDAQLRQLVDARNELDSVTYQVQRLLEQAGDAVAEHDRARAEMLVSDARTALDEQAPIDRLRSLTGELHQMAQVLSTSGQGQAAAGSTGQSAGSGQAEAADDSDVIDADFTTH